MCNATQRHLCSINLQERPYIRCIERINVLTVLSTVSSRHTPPTSFFPLGGGREGVNIFSDSAFCVPLYAPQKSGGMLPYRVDKNSSPEAS